MTPLAAADFRQESFETMREFKQLLAECSDHYREVHHAKLVEVVITESQHKWLKFDQYLHGVAVQQMKKDKILFVRGVHVLVSEFEEGCPNCGGELC